MSFFIENTFVMREIVGGVKGKFLFKWTSNRTFWLFRRSYIIRFPFLNACALMVSWIFIPWSRPAIMMSISLMSKVLNWVISILINKPQPTNLLKSDSTEFNSGNFSLVTPKDYFTIPVIATITTFIYFEKRTKFKNYKRLKF